MEGKGCLLNVAGFMVSNVSFLSFDLLDVHEVMLFHAASCCFMPFHTASYGFMRFHAVSCVLSKQKCSPRVTLSE